MMRNKIKYRKIKEKLNKKQINEIIKILISENKSSILAKLSHKNIENYLDRVVVSKELDLYIVEKTNIIGYAIIAKKPEYLTSNFTKYQLYFLLDLLKKINLITIFNLILFKLGIENLLISKEKKKIIIESINLNLLAIDKSYQSLGIGKKFMKFIIANIKIKKRRYFSCEIDNDRSKKFYINKLGFIEIGRKIRVPKVTKVLIKTI